MIYSLQGKIVLKQEKFLVLQVGKISFQIFCALPVVKKFSVGQEVRIFTKLLLARDKLQLYGFPTLQALELFNFLEAMTGVGPKTALALSSFGSLEKLKEILESNKTLPETRGISKKRLSRILLELTGKIKETEKQKNKEAKEEEDEVLAGLKTLGFSEKEARTVLSQIPGNIKDAQERIKTALQILGRQKSF